MQRREAAGQDHSFWKVYKDKPCDKLKALVGNTVPPDAGGLESHRGVDVALLDVSKPVIRFSSRPPL